MARALVLLHNAAAGMVELIIDPLDEELLGAIRAPTPPLQRLVDQIDAIPAYRAGDEAEPQRKDEPEDYIHHCGSGSPISALRRSRTWSCREGRPRSPSFRRPG
jgi:hypothetical protein